ncbi:MAG: arsenosugar biosynthesis radical SAM (seleno)protein ArsS [Actinomycetota bacterium]
MDIAQRFKNLERKSIKHISINIGYKCNQLCTHCHLEAGPHRNELMDIKIVDRLIGFLKKIKPESIEITGGSPELMPSLIILLSRTRQLARISMRTNLTLLHLHRYSHILKYLRKHSIELVASLPCYTEKKVDEQRGKNVYRVSINNLRLLNKAGFGSDEGKILSLVYNPSDGKLPPPQSCLEKTYKKKMEEEKITFNNLYTMTNVALGRFKKNLIHNNKYRDYVSLLENNFNPGTVSNLMCLNQITVDWKGNIYDCDFNLAANLPSNGFSSIEQTDISSLVGQPIHTGEHCLACSAGKGSSCHGELK